MNCKNNCNCGSERSCEGEQPKRINTDRIRLKQLGNVVYRGVDKDSINRFEVLHFELYFLCSECGHTQKFEKDETSYHTIKFMANYPCISCGSIGGFSDFMVCVSPDQGVGMEITKDACITEEQFMAALQTLESMRTCGNERMGRV